MQTVFVFPSIHQLFTNIMSVVSTSSSSPLGCPYLAAVNLLGILWNEYREYTVGGILAIIVGVTISRFGGNAVEDAIENTSESSEPESSEPESSEPESSKNESDTMRNEIRSVMRAHAFSIWFISSYACRLGAALTGVFWLLCMYAIGHADDPAYCDYGYYAFSALLGVNLGSLLSEMDLMFACIKSTVNPREPQRVASPQGVSTTSDPQVAPCPSPAQTQTQSQSTKAAFVTVANSSNITIVITREEDQCTPQRVQSLSDRIHSALQSSRNDPDSDVESE